MRLLTAMLMAAILGACASAGDGQPRPDRNVLTQAQIDAAVETNAYDLIRVYRPLWLNVRGANSVSSDNPIMVYLDGTRIGDTDALRSISPNDIFEIRFYGAAQAQARFGLGNTRGAIAITTR